MGQPMDAANMLKPALTRGHLRVVGATTRQEFDRWIRPDAALERRFMPVEIPELSEEQTFEVLVARRPRLEGHHLLAISDETLREAIRVSGERQPSRRQPDKSIDLVDEACSLRRVREAEGPPAEVVALAAERERLLAEEQGHIDALFETGGGIIERVSYGTFLAFENMGLVMERLFTGRTTPRGRPDAENKEVRLQDEARRLADAHARRLAVDDRLREALLSAGLVLTGEDVAMAAAAE
jgi:ATP-dependent Clp protease ATP-binding subunit ClpA